MKNIIENVKLVFQMTIIGAILLYIGTTLFMPNLTISIFKFQPFIVVTESMDPEIAVNDIVVATEFDIETAEKGDIITFYADIDYNGTQEVVTHYIYEIDESGEEPIIRTHRHFEYGEEIVPDTWLITADDVIGTYSFHVQSLGYIVGFLKNPIGWAVIGFNVLIIGSITYINKKSKQAELENNSEEMKS